MLSIHIIVSKCIIQSNDLQKKLKQKFLMFDLITSHIATKRKETFLTYVKGILRQIGKENKINKKCGNESINYECKKVLGKHYTK